MINEEQMKIGLDFGTAFSFMAGKIKDHPEPDILLPMASGQENFLRGIPSLLWVDNHGEIKVGTQAEDALWNDTNNVVSSIKTKLSQKENFVLNGKTFTPRQIAEQIIKYIFNIAQTAAEETFRIFPQNSRIVMGVPISFGTEEREILKNIVQDIGYEVELLPEPMAAAAYYAYMLGRNFSKALVCDIGAGTFDVAFLERNLYPSKDEPYPYRCPPKGSDGDDIAGDKIDETFASYIIDSSDWSEEFKRKVRNKDNIEHRHLVGVARKMKETLSSHDTVKEYFSDARQEIIVSQVEFEQAVAPIINGIADKCYHVVERCGMQNKDFPILLVGGNSNIPMVKAALSQKFPKQAEKNQIQIRFPSKAVVFGCALYAEDPTFARKVNFAYAIESFNKNTNQPCLQIEIPAGAKLPYIQESHYETRHAAQKAVEFRIYEVPDITDNEEPVDIEQGDYKDIKVVHSFNKAVPKGTDVTCRLKLTESGILEISISDNGITSGETRKEFNVGLNKG